MPQDPRITTSSSLKAEPAPPPEKHPASRDETHDSVDPATGALLNPEAHREFYRKAAAAKEEPPKAAAADAKK